MVGVGEVVGVGFGGGVEGVEERAEGGEAGADDAEALFDGGPGYGADGGVGAVFYLGGVVCEDSEDGGYAHADGRVVLVGLLWIEGGERVWGQRTKDPVRRCC